MHVLKRSLWLSWGEGLERAKGGSTESVRRLWSRGEMMGVWTKVSKVEVARKDGNHQQVSFSLRGKAHSLSVAGEAVCPVASPLLPPPLQPCWPPRPSVNKPGVNPPFVLDVPSDIRKAGINMVSAPPPGVLIKRHLIRKFFHDRLV